MFEQKPGQVKLMLDSLRDYLKALKDFLYPPDLPIPMTWEIRDGQLLINGYAYACRRKYSFEWLAMEMCWPMLRAIRDTKGALTVTAFEIEIPIAVALFQSGVITEPVLRGATPNGDGLSLWVPLGKRDFHIVICDCAQQDYYSFCIEGQPKKRVTRVRSALDLKRKIASREL